MTSSLYFTHVESWRSITNEIYRRPKPKLIEDKKVITFLDYQNITIGWCLPIENSDDQLSFTMDAPYIFMTLIMILHMTLRRNMERLDVLLCRLCQRLYLSYRSSPLTGHWYRYLICSFRLTVTTPIATFDPGVEFNKFPQFKSWF